MAAATLPLSRSMRIPLSNRQDTNESVRIPDEWGPSSVPPPPSSNIPWDDQVVPALRKKLEAQSKHLSKRISRIEESDLGWTRSERREPRAAQQDRRMSREVVQHHQRESSIDQFHNRFASVRAADVIANSFPFDVAESQQDSVTGAVLSNDATARAREKARQIAARQKSSQQQQSGGSSESFGSSADTTAYGSRQGLESSIDAIPEGQAVDGGAGPSSTSFERKRLRTQSTPMRPSLDVIDPDYAAASGASRRAQNQSAHDAQPSSPSTETVSRYAHGHQRSSSLSRRKAAAAMDPKLMEEFGPLGATPSPTAKLLRAHQEIDPSSPSSLSSPSTRKRNIQPDAFRSLSKQDQLRYVRESSAPPAFGDADNTVSEFGASPGSKSVNSWEDEIIPTVARKLQQEQFLKAGKEGRLSRYEGLIDTWDKNGLPLSRSDVMAMQKARRLQEEQEAQQQGKREVGEDEGDGQTSTPGPAPVFSNLSPRDAEFGGERSRSRASSRRSQRSARSAQQQQLQGQQQQQREAVESIPMQTLEWEREVVQPLPHLQGDAAPESSVAMTAATAAAGDVRNQGDARRNGDDRVDKGGCCCVVM
ncbi:uncharacterized protein SRS1_12626 [Sporisorium reilianum f. sp. reilianum]|uniref:Uncharacterized protein n=1 Tax=Sporisorium reilianum f. sp. reilianum TaxID=72559 RepID=A0A2N8UAB6_9BASI|nr:uncharacterized protein SRS1_12626 [Sporisorium reilianum f. sp. reilianum]